MSYRFIRRISKSVAEVSTPSGHTIRLPYTGSLPKRGSIVQPQKNNCCCPQRLQFDSSPNKAIRTDPTPRRVSRRKGRILSAFYPIIYPGVDLSPSNFPYNPDLPKTYTVIFQPAHFDYPASKFPLYGIGIVISNVPDGPKIQGLTPVKFGRTVYQFEGRSFGTAYDNWGNITYYENFGWESYGFLSEYKYNAHTGKVSDTGVTIVEYVKNHKVKYPLSDKFCFNKYYIGDSEKNANFDNILGTPGYSASFILNSIQPKTRFFLVDSVSRASFISEYSRLEYVEVN